MRRERSTRQRIGPVCDSCMLDREETLGELNSILTLALKQIPYSGAETILGAERAFKKLPIADDSTEIRPPIKINVEPSEEITLSEVYLL